MDHFARVTDQGRKAKTLTPEEYGVFSRDAYEWVIDGLQSPPRCLRGGKVVELRQAEFEALATLIRDHGGSRSPRKLFPDAANHKAASKRFQVARKKIEPSNTPGRRSSFPAVGRGERDLCYKFEPGTGLRYCLIERAEALQASPQPTSALSWDWPPTMTVSAPNLGSMKLFGLTERPKPPAVPPAALSPKPRLTPKDASEAVDGILVRIHSLTVGSDVRVRVALVNQTAQRKCVEYLTLNVGDSSWKAFLPGKVVRSRSRRSVLRSARAGPILEPWMISIEARGVVKGVLVFRLPDRDGDAIVRPHVLKMEDGPTWPQI